MAASYVMWIRTYRFKVDACINIRQTLYTSRLRHTVSGQKWSSSHVKNNTVSESKVHSGFLTITLSVVGRFLGWPYRSRPMPKQFCRLSVCLSPVCPLSWRACIVQKPLNPSDEFWHECCPGRKQHHIKIWWWSVQGLGYSAPKWPPKLSNSRFFMHCGRTRNSFATIFGRMLVPTRQHRVKM